VDLQLCIEIATYGYDRIGEAKLLGSNEIDHKHKFRALL